MRHLHESLRRDHHLKHFARLQYGLFLKNIGLTLEQALAFWRAEFTKKMDVDKVQQTRKAINKWVIEAVLYAGVIQGVQLNLLICTAVPT